MKHAFRKIIPLLLALCLALSGCTAQEAEKKDSSKLQIVCTNFPAYDFAREMAEFHAQNEELGTEEMDAAGNVGDDLNVM